jgi:hypothetical protein
MDDVVLHQQRVGVDEQQLLLDPDRERETSSKLRRSWFSSPLGLGVADEASRLPAPSCRGRLLTIDDAPLSFVEWAEPIRCTSSASCVIDLPFSDMQGAHG